MNKTRNKSKLLALTIAMILVLVISATLAACNDTAGQGAMKVVTFDFNDGTGNTFEKVLNINEPISYTPPAREGYDFNGWAFDKEGNSPFDASKAETSSITLYAQWKIRTYAVYFFLYEDEEPIATETVNYGESATAPSDETIAQYLKEGDTFKAWTESFDNVKSNTYVYAEISQINCTVTFKDDENVVKTVEGKYGTKVTLPLSSELPSRAGYSFAGWFDEDGNQATSETTFKGNATYYSKWTLNAPQTPTVEGNKEIVYGENAVLTASVSNKIDGVTYVYEWFENGVSVANGDSATIANLGVGTHVIRCSAYATTDGQTSTPSSANIVVTVKKATLTAKIKTINVKYGDVLPTLTIEYTGFVYGEDKTAVDESNVQFDTQYVQYSPVDEYTIDANGFVSSNYDVTFEQSKIVVGKKDVTAKNNLVFDKKYNGQTLSASFANDVFDGVCQGHVLTLILTTTASGVGEYDFANGTITSNLKIVDEEGVTVTNNYNVTFTATASISLAMITEQDYTVPSSEENTFTYDTHQHGEGVISDEFYVTYSLTQDGEYASAQLHFTDAGEYTVYYKVSRDNYQTVSGSYVVTINKAKLDVTVKNQNAVYGAEFAIDETLYSVSGNDYHLLTYALACAYEVGNGVGTYPINLIVDDARGSASRNFDITVNNAVLTVEKATLSVTLNPVSVAYGNELDLDIAKLATINGLYKADDIANIVTLSTDYKADNAHVVGGEYYVYCTLKDENGNYALSSQKAQVTVTKREISVIVKDMIVTYGEALGQYAYTITDGSIVDGDDESTVIVCQSDYVSEHGNHTPVGKVAITATCQNDNYSLTVIDGKITVTKRPVTVNLYLDNQPHYGSSISEVLADYNVRIDCTSDIQAADGEFVTLYRYYSDIELVRGKYGTEADESYVQGMIGSFELRANVADENLLNNYDVTITSDEITVVASYYVIDIEKKYAYKEGEYASFEIANAVQNLLCYGDEIEGTIRLKKNEIGTYEFVKNSDETAFNELFETVGFKVTNAYGDDVTEYYLPSYYDFNIKIEIAQISIAHNVNGLTKFTYDGDYHGVTVEGTDNDVTIQYSTDNENWTEVAPTFMNVIKGSNYQVVPYTVYYRLSKYVEDVDEIVTYEDSYQVQIDPRTAYVRAYDQTTTYGEELVLDQTRYEYEEIIISALVNDLQYLKVSIYTNNYSVGKDVANYNLCIDAYVCTADNEKVASPNYIIHTTNATLKVVAKSLTLAHVNNYEVVYGEEAGAWNGYKIVDDDQNEHEEVRQYITLIPQYKVGDGVGTYTVKATCSNENYTLDTTYLELTVVKREICVKTKDASFVYGQAVSFEYEISEGSLYGNDKLNVTFDTYGETIKAVGKYAVMPRLQDEDGINANYSISTQDGVVTITKATLTVALSKTQTITYGDDMPSYDFIYTGFVYDETAVDVEHTVSYTCEYSSTKRAGTFDVIVSGSVLANYDIVYVNSQLIVKKATLLLTAVEHEAITYGDDVPTDFAYEADGFVNGDDKSLLDGNVSFSTLYVKGADASDTKYTFNVVCADLDNYTIHVGEAKSLVVNKASYTKEQVNEALAKVNLSGTYEYGKTLAAYSLTGTGFEWINANTLVTCDINDTGYAVRYCKDKTNYNVYDDGATYIKINLAKADAPFEYDGEFGARWTGSTIDYVSIMNGGATPEGANVASLVRDAQGWDPTFNYTLIAPTDRTQMIDGGIYKVRVSASETVNYNASYADVVFNVYAAQLDNEYLTVEGALAKATSGKTVYLIGNAFLSQNATVNSGVTLILGLKTANYTKTLGKVDTSVEYAASGRGDYSWKSIAADYTLTICGDTTLTIANGNVLVAGLLGQASVRFEGHTSGAYSKIINDGNITMNGGIFDIRGLVNGNGQATFNSGSVYSPFVVRDFKGGSYTVFKAWSVKKVAPFSEYEMPNIQCNSRYYSGATLTGYADLYAGDQHNTTTINAISSNGILQVASGGYIDKSYDANTEVTTLTIVGSVKLGSLSLSVKASIFSSTVKMSDTYFPIPWTYNINIGNGSTATSLSSSYDYKVMPGAVITVRTNAKLTTTGNVAVYSNFTDNNNIQQYPASKGTAATFMIDGGTFEATAFGGIVQGTGKGGTAKVSKTLSVSVYEHNNSDRYSVSETARLANGTSMTKGATYTL